MISSDAIAGGPSTDSWRALQALLAGKADENEAAGILGEATLTALRDFGVFRAILPLEAGGWAAGMSQGNPIALWTINRLLGFADGSVAHALQVHNNALDLIMDFGSQGLKEKALGFVQAGDIFAAWGASRHESPPWIASHIDEDTYNISGTAFFCTNAGFADEALIMAACPEDTHVPYNGLIIGLIDARQPGVEILPDWWNKATGMVATASHRVALKDIVLKREDIVADGRDVKHHAIQTRFMPQFASNMLGMMECLYEEARTVVAKSKSGDPFACVRLGQLSILVARVDALMKETDRVWRKKRAQYPRMANIYRLEAGRALLDALDHAGTILGGASMMTMFKYPKVSRDAMTLLRHENTDRMMDTLGQAAIETGDADINFSGRAPVVI